MLCLTNKNIFHFSFWLVLRSSNLVFRVSTEGESELGGILEETLLNRDGLTLCNSSNWQSATRHVTFHAGFSLDVWRCQIKKLFNSKLSITNSDKSRF